MQVSLAIVGKLAGDQWSCQTNVDTSTCMKIPIVHHKQAIKLTHINSCCEKERHL